MNTQHIIQRCKASGLCDKHIALGGTCCEAPEVPIVAVPVEEYVLLAWKLNPDAITGIEVYCSKLITVEHANAIRGGLTMNGYHVRVEKVVR